MPLLNCKMKMSSKTEIPNKENSQNTFNRVPLRAQSNQKIQITKPSSKQPTKPIQTAKSIPKFSAQIKFPTQIQPKKPLLFAKPTTKFTSMKINDPFKETTKTGSKTTKGFQFYYQNSKIPCKINHGSISNKLIWETKVDLES